MDLWSEDREFDCRLLVGFLFVKGYYFLGISGFGLEIESTRVEFE